MDYYEFCHRYIRLDTTNWILSQRPHLKVHRIRFGFERTNAKTYDKNQLICEVNLPQLFEKSMSFAVNMFRNIVKNMDNEYHILLDYKKLHATGFHFGKPCALQEKNIRDYHVPDSERKQSLENKIAVNRSLEQVETVPKTKLNDLDDDLTEKLNRLSEKAKIRSLEGNAIL